MKYLIPKSQKNKLLTAKRKKEIRLFATDFSRWSNKEPIYVSFSATSPTSTPAILEKIHYPALHCLPRFDIHSQHQCQINP